MGIGYEKLLTTDILPHNTYVDVFIVAGPMALVLFLALFLSALWKALISTWRREYAGVSPLYNSGILAAIVSHILIVNSLSVLGGKINWLILGLTFGLLAARAAEDPVEAPCDQIEETAPVLPEAAPVDA